MGYNDDDYHQHGSSSSISSNNTYHRSSDDDLGCGIRGNHCSCRHFALALASACLPSLSLCHSSLRHFECRGDMWQCRVESSAAVCLPLPSLSVVQSWSSEATARKAQLSAWPPQSSAVFATLRDCRLLLYEFKENLVIWRRADGPLPLTVACLKGREEKWKKKGKSTCERKHVWGKCLVSNIGCKQLASLEVSLGYGWTVAEAAATASV